MATQSDWTHGLGQRRRAAGYMGPGSDAERLDARSMAERLDTRLTVERLDARSTAEWLDARLTAERMDARSTVVTVRQRPTAGGEVLTETRLLDDGFQAEEMRVRLRSTEVGRLKARSTGVSLDCTIGWVGGG
ncbi:hypothetical protein E5676_scaffold325G001500 [Cucumis melo var. makuwa]|uniref:Uncharacterized protein n=1 Tax=Cucumis melo var. makuwa TaxID=1194695 RepID=A0A5A7V5C6_CUCMM|nr:hypothetical protein E6C27_scaffold130G00060 [Cucumis melo var. makuwa]TYK27451.1 hypothetical protein E5676_scaffold325G001500 [Cucumis melo var. makuwa]